MIIGIGIDLVECNRFLDWSAFKKQRIFTKNELEYADNDNANAEKHLANFWAAREACIKALHTGFGDNITSQDDAYWEKNVAGCIKNNIPFSTYLYSYAQNTTQASGIITTLFL